MCRRYVWFALHSLVLSGIVWHAYHCRFKHQKGLLFTLLLLRGRILWNCGSSFNLTCFGCIWICLNPVSPMMQDEPAEDACQNTDAWKECGEASGLGFVTSWCQWMFFRKTV
jgi:hypothetical protein